MSLKDMQGIPPALSGLDAAIRLKTELLQRLVLSTPIGWPEQLALFMTRLEASELQDATALVVLLADLRAEMHVLSTAYTAASELDTAMSR